MSGCGRCGRWRCRPSVRGETSDAVVLFVERARAVDPDFVVDATSVPAVAEICRRLDGIPLAIELAAARVAAMGPAEIAGHLDERFRLLTGGRRGRVERHQTLRAAIEWSYSLLSRHANGWCSTGSGCSRPVSTRPPRWRCAPATGSNAGM